MILYNKKIFLSTGGITTILLSVFFLFYFYGKLLHYPNGVYFGANGDGLQAYYTAIYHVKYDDSLWRMNGMNYPYGENVFFAGCQPLVTNVIKIVSYVVDISNYTVGIMNLIMLFSVVLSAWFLFLILKYFKLPQLYAAIAATAIAFLSPQIARLSGHYSLTYQFAIPLFIYGLIRFYEQPSIRKSIFISVFVFIMSATHLYFLGIMGVVSLFYWILLYLKKHNDFAQLSFVAKHVFIQLVVPFLLMQLLVYFYNGVNDRTSFPWGFMIYKSHWDGVFYPYYRPYQEQFSQYYDKTKVVEPEGIAYVGIISVVVFLILMLKAMVSLIQLSISKINPKPLIHHPLLGILFWASFFSLAYSFALPFEGKRGWLLNYIGPLRQMRGIGRFNLIFFYVMNIVTVVQLYEWTKNRLFIHLLVLVLTLYWLTYDAYYNNIEMQDMFNNSIESLKDKKNLLPEDKWYNEINVADYQGIIALPYFHIGSENIWLSPESDIVKDVFIASLKTGLPITDVTLSRTSLSQTYKNVQIIKEPYRKLEIVDDFKNTKPFLVLVREKELNEDEKKLLSKCKKMRTTTPNYSIYELRVETLKHISDNLYKETTQKLSQARTFDIDGSKSTDSLKTYYNWGFENMVNEKSYSGKGCYEGLLVKYNTLFEDTIPNWKDEEYTISFWIDDFTKDLYPRLTVELRSSDSAGNILETSYYKPWQKLRVMDGTWALIENNFRLKNKTDKLKVTVWTEDYLNEKMIFRVDELLIKPKKTDVYKNITGESITFNNRTYLAK